MPFEIVLANDDDGLRRLRGIYIKLYFSHIPDLKLDDVKENRKDIILIDCVKTLMKNNDNFLNSFTIFEIPDEYQEDISIGNTTAFENLIIKNKPYDGKDQKIRKIQIPQNRTIIQSIFEVNRNPFPIPFRRRPNGAFANYWDNSARAQPIFDITPPKYECDEA